ncbi:MAG TPA: helical backbone metal receptor [Longimicrobiales bacterium]
MNHVRITLLLCTATLAAACGTDRSSTQPAAITLRDGAGREVRLAAPATRVVSLLPAATDVILALGAGDRLVARTDYDTHASLAALPSVGGGLTPSLEWLAALQPDLVIAWRDAQSRTLVRRLDEIGIPTYAAGPESIADAKRLARDVGKMLGLEPRADSLLSAFEASFEAVRRRIPAGAHMPGVLYLVALDPPRAAGPGTFVDELITAAGGRNVFADAPALWPEVSLEELVRRQPDVVIVAAGGLDAPALDRLRAAPGWRELHALRAGRIATVDTDLFNRPGPGLARAVERLAAILHPELFQQEATP